MSETRRCDHGLPLAPHETGCESLGHARKPQLTPPAEGETAERPVFWQHAISECNAAHAALDRKGAPKTRMARRIRGEGDQEIAIGLADRIAYLGRYKAEGETAEGLSDTSLSRSLRLASRRPGVSSLLIPILEDAADTLDAQAAEIATLRAKLAEAERREAKP